MKIKIRYLLENDKTYYIEEKVWSGWNTLSFGEEGYAKTVIYGDSKDEV